MYKLALGGYNKKITMDWWLIEVDVVVVKSFLSSITNFLTFPDGYGKLV